MNVNSDYVLSLGAALIERFSRELKEVSMEHKRCLDDDQKTTFMLTMLEHWKKVPELRFGQLIDILTDPAIYGQGNLYCVEDQDLLDKVGSWVEGRKEILND